MADRAPRLSIVVACHDARTSVAECLESIERQCDDDTEVVVVDNSSDGSAEIVRELFPRLVVHHRPPTELIPELWAEGIRRSRGEAVVITTAHCVPDGGWVSAMLAALASPAAAAGGPIDNDPRGSAVDWAVFFARYAAFMPPVGEGFVAEVAGDNAVYRRAAIERCAALWRDGFWEAAVNAELRRAGERLWLAPAAVVRHRRSYDFAGFVRQRFVHGMRYGRDRGRGLGIAGRAARVLAAPLVPAVLAARIVRQVQKKRRHRLELARSLPLLIAFLLAWTCGEVIGYVRG